MSDNVDLRTYVFLDSLQKQLAGTISTLSRGFLPVSGQACCVIEIAPGIEINRLTDVAVKTTSVEPGLQVVERSFGLLEVHSDEQAETRAAGAAVLQELGKTEADRLRPRILTSQLIKNIWDQHGMLVNRAKRYGNILEHGDTLYILEVEPAGYAYFAANEAEKASHINVIDVRGFGKYGRVHLGGEESEVRESLNVIEAKLATIDGRDDHIQWAAKQAAKARAKS